MTMMISHLITTIRLPRRLRACIYTALLCAAIGIVADARAQSKSQVCAALDMSTADCALIQSVSYDPPSFPWRVTVDTSVAGGSSLRSADIGRNQQSCIVLEVSRPANSVISVAGRTSSQGGFDQLQIDADNLRIDTISAAVDQTERDWRQQSYFLPTAISTLRWCYAKDGSDDRGQDAAWIDNLSFNTSNISYQSRICAALDLTTGDCSLIQSVTFDPPELLWVITSATSVAGGSSLRSADIGRSQQSCIVLEVSRAANSVISVAGRTSSEGSFDQLQIDADNLRLDTISGERDWRQQSYSLPAAISALRWCYTKDGSISEGQDAAWIDNLSFSDMNLSTELVCLVLDMSTEDCSQIQSVSFDPPSFPWLITMDTSVAGGSSLRSANIGRNQQSCIVLEVSLPANAMISVAGRTNSEGGFDQLQIDADNLHLDTISAPRFQTERNWRQQSYFLPTAISILRWCYAKDGSMSEGQDAAWIDNLSFSGVDTPSNIPLSTDQVCLVLDISTDDCSQIRSLSFDPPSFPWRITSETSIAGGSSLRSADIGRNQQSCIVLEVSLPVHSVISVASRTSSEGLFDLLQIDADNLRLNTISAPRFKRERDWRQQSYFLPTAISTLSWCYTKNFFTSSGQDAAWIDNLSFSTSNISYQRRICVALDLTAGDCSQIQSVTYNPPELLWVITSATSVAGGSSLRSADIGDDQQSCIVLEVSLPANSMISVAGRTSSEGGADQLQIDADNLRLDTISDPFSGTERNWRQESYFLPTAISTLSWCYVKNFFTSSGQDAAWIDNLSFDTLDSYQSRICEALDLTAGDCSLIQSVSYDPPQRPWTITMATFVAGGSSLRNADIGRNQQSCLVLELSLPANSVISVAGLGSFGQLQISADQLRLDTISAPSRQTERDWRQQSYFLPTAISTLSWCSNFRSVWIDNLSFETLDSYQSRVCAALDLTADDCSLIQSIIYEPPQRLWVIAPETSIAGGSSLRSGDIDDSEQSCLVLELSLPANAMISVAGRTSSEGGFDQLEIDADNLHLDTISAPRFQTERNWRQEIYFLPTAISILRWCYTKNDSGVRGEDAAWIDNLSFDTPDSYQERICAALDLTAGDCSLIQSVSYEPSQLLWVITPETSIAGGSSLRSGDIDDNQQSCIVLEVALPANSVISVAGRTSSENGRGQLQIDANDLRLDTLSVPVGQTERDWRHQSYFLPTAISTLSWCYAKNGSDDRGQDAAWIDNLSFSTSDISYQSRICEALDLTTGDCSLIQSVSYEPPQRLWVITSETSIAGGSSLLSADIGGSQQSCIVLEVSLPANSVISVAGRTSSRGGRDQLQIDADDLRLDTISAPNGYISAPGGLIRQTERNWRQESYFLPAAISTLRWCYDKRTFSGSGEDAVWIDNLSFSASNISYQSRICTALDLTDNRCSLIQSIRYDPPELLWIITSQTSAVGRTSMRSGAIDNDQRSCLILELSLPANSVISVAGRTSSEGGGDQLYIVTDNLLLDTLSAPFRYTERDWRQQSYFLPTTISALGLCYTKNGSDDRGQDAAWIDSLSFSTSSIPYQSRVCDALDLTAGDCSLIQSVSYEPPQRLWVITSETSIAGGSSLHSADIGDRQQSCLVLELSLPANAVISVAGRSSSEGGDDQLQIDADNLRLDTLSAPVFQTERNWRQESYFLPTAISTLSWCYAKDFGARKGQDAAWIDNLSFSTSNIPYQSRICEALDLTTGDCSLIQSVSYEPPQRLWVITPETSIAGGSSLRSADIGFNQTSCLVLELSLPANSVISVAGRTSSEGGADRLQIDASNLRLATISAPRGQSERDWRQEIYFLPTAISTLRWCYDKRTISGRGEDAVWIDNLSFDTLDSYRSRVCAALDLTAGDCSLIQSISYEPPELLWIITSQTSAVGRTSMRSGAIDNDQQSCIVLEVSLPANSVISVAGRTSSQGIFDQLQIDADNLRLNTISGERGWRQQSYLLPAAISTLSWCYAKDDSSVRGEDAAWIDNLSFETPDSYQSRVCAALDLTAGNCSLIQSVSYEPPQRLWVITSAISIAGGSSLRSGDIGRNQQSCLVLELSLPANSVISVAARTSSQGGRDQLLINADNLRLDTISAPDFLTERDWRQEIYLLPTAISILRWCYAKDISRDRGQDAAWIDNLSFDTLDSYRSRICAALDLTDQNCAQIDSITYEPPQRLWVITPETSIAGGSSLRSADIGDNQQSCIVLEVLLPANSVISVAARTSSQGGRDQLLINADNLRLDTISAPDFLTERGWRLERYLLPTAISTLRWCYTKDRFGDVGADAAWIDNLSFDTLDSYRSRVCAALDLTDQNCAQIDSISYEPPQRLWVITPETSIAGGSSLRSADIGDNQQSCIVLEVSLPANSAISVAARTSSQGGRDQLLINADNLRLDTISAPDFQTERDWRQQSYLLPTAISTLRWCYTKDRLGDGGADAAWIDNLLLVTPANRYRAEIAVSSPVITATPPNSFQFQVTVTAVSAILPPPLNWVLIASGIDNIASADTDYALAFSGNSARTNVLATPDNPFLPSSMLLALEDRPLLHGASVTALTVRLPSARRLAVLEITAPTAVTQTAPDAAIEIAVVASAIDNFGMPLEQTRLTLVVEGVNNADVPQSAYALIFADGTAQTTITVGLTRRGDAGSIELSVIGGDIRTTARVALSPAPRVLVSITLSATNSNLAQTTASTAVAAELIVTALDNYGDPIEAGDIGLQIFASNGAIVQSSLTLMIEADGTARQTVEILPQNDLDTTLTVLILRGTLDPSVQLLPDGGIRVAVRALRVLRQLQLSLVGAQSPLRQIDPSLPVLASIHLTGLDQYDQPIAFPEVVLTTTAEPSTTVVTLNPQQAASTAAERVLLMLEVVFSERLDTTITITIAGAVVTTNQLVVRALYDRRPPIRSLKVDDTETDVTELDLVVALRWLINQRSSTQTLVVNLTIPSTGVMTAGIDNLQQLFTKDIDRVDLNRDGRADQLDLRILVRYMSGLPDAALSDQQIRMDLIRLLVGQELQAP